MSKTTLIMAVLGGLVLVGGGFLLVQGDFLTQNEVEDVEAALEQAILEGDGSLECTFEDELGTEGVAYVKDGNIRLTMTPGESPQNPEGQDTDQESYTLLLDNEIFVWDNLTTEGFVINLDETEEEEGMPSRTDYVAQLTQYNTGCVETRVSDDNFEVPGDVRFQDFEEFQQQQIQQQLEQQEEFEDMMEGEDMEFEVQE